MRAWESEPAIGIDDRRAQSFCQVQHRRQGFRITPEFTGDDHRPLRFGQQARRVPQRLGISCRSRRRTEELRVGHNHRLVDFGFLDIGIEANVDGPSRFGHGDAISLQERIGDGVDGVRLVVELYVFAHG